MGRETEIGATNKREPPLRVRLGILEQAFDVGETFSGVPYDASLAAVEELRALVPEGVTMAQLALRWILMFDAVTCAIPGAKTPAQAADNVAASDLPPLDEGSMKAVRDVYDRLIRPHVHQRW